MTILTIIRGWIDPKYFSINLVLIGHQVRVTFFCGSSISNADIQFAIVRMSWLSDRVKCNFLDSMHAFDHIESEQFS